MNSSTNYGYQQDGYDRGYDGHQPERRRGRVARRVGAAVAAAAGVILAVGIGHSLVKKSEQGAHEPTVGDVKKQVHVVDASKMLSDQLKSNPQARQIAEKMQATLQDRATNIAGNVLNDEQHQDAEHRVKRTVNKDFDGKVVGYTLLESTDGNSFSVDFGATSDGKLNASDLQDTTILYGNNVDDTSSKSISVIDTPDGTVYYNLSGHAARSGPNSDPTLTFSVGNQTQAAVDISELTKVSYAFDGYVASV
jgi:hypothetical protein